MEGTVVTVLGSGVNAAGRDAPWEPGDGRLPDGPELARHLARHFGLGVESEDLARVVRARPAHRGRVDLYRALRELVCTRDRAPGAVHRSVAASRGGCARRVATGRRSSSRPTTTPRSSGRSTRSTSRTTCRSSSAAGEHRGRFVHVPWWTPDEGGPRAITMPNEYVDLPIDEDGALERTVIVKLHGGAADLGPGWPALRDNFVVTEDDYIGYLTQSPVESLIPLQVLNKIRDSHFLFLGYRMRDWSVRVFLQRIWGDRPLDARSWAVDPGHDALERELWEQRGVRLVDECARTRSSSRSTARSAPLSRRRRDGDGARAPYIGLDFFVEEDAGLFFGRDAERKRIIGNLRASRLTLLYAESGVGKCSLLRAGVSARLRQLRRDDVSGRGSVQLRPGRLQQLAGRRHATVPCSRRSRAETGTDALRARRPGARDRGRRRRPRRDAARGARPVRGPLPVRRRRRLGRLRRRAGPVREAPRPAARTSSSPSARTPTR